MCSGGPFAHRSATPHVSLCCGRTGGGDSRQQVIRMLLVSDWTWNAGLQKCIEELFSTVGATKVIEDGWQKERHGESFHSSSV